MQQYSISTYVGGDVMTFYTREDQVDFTVTQLSGPEGRGYGVFERDGLDADDNELPALIECLVSDYGTLENAQRVAVQLAYKLMLKKVGIVI